MKYKYNGQWVELYIKALDSMPIGSIIGFAGTDIPNGWLICDGSTLDEETYPELYDALGGSGSTFTLPDYQGRVPVGYDANDTDFNAIGKTGGSKELQEHTHTYNISTQGTTGADGRRLIVWNGSGSTYDNASGAIQNAGTGNSGNLQPYIVQYFIIKAKNTTPTMASIVNTKNNSTEDGYSCDYINKLVDYSTTEINTGKTWIDGKPIYRKVMNITLGTALNTLYEVATFNSNVLIIQISGYFISYSHRFNLPFAYNGEDIHFVSKDNKLYEQHNYQGANSMNCTIIVEYTKTID